MRIEGRIQDWNDDKGFGFATPVGGGDKAFVHVKAFARVGRRPADGDLIIYDTGRDDRGRLQAKNIRFAVESLPVDERPTTGGLMPLFALLFCAVFALAAHTGRIPMALAIAYAVMSTVAFLAYGRDKWAARTGRRRTPESTLQFYGLACGWPGALLAQRVFRHKSRKRAFQSGFRFCVVANVALLWLLGSETGRGWIRALWAMVTQ